MFGTVVGGEPRKVHPKRAPCEIKLWASASLGLAPKKNEPLALSNHGHSEVIAWRAIPPIGSVGPA